MTLDTHEAVSSGGVVARVQGGAVEILLLRDTRHDDWVLPKGHVETGDTLEQAALREIREEAGVTSARILNELGTARRYVVRAQEMKTIHYFLILAGEGEPTGHLESPHHETAWFTPGALPKMYLPEQEKVIRDNLAAIQNLAHETGT